MLKMDAAQSLGKRPNAHKRGFEDNANSTIRGWGGGDDQWMYSLSRNMIQLHCSNQSQNVLLYINGALILNLKHSLGIT